MNESAPPLHILVLCTGNSCRSIMAEVLFNDLGGGRIRAFSAGSHPAGTVNPAAVAKLRKEGHSTDGLASKSWDRFSAADSPAIDLVITVCDNAAGEACPVWIGAPVTVHWGIRDPADANDADRERAFDKTYTQLRQRIERTLELPLDSLDRRYLKESLHRIHDACSRES